MPRVPSRVKFITRDLFDLEERTVFIWQGTMYSAGKFDPEDDQLRHCKRMASGWTNNPDDRWIDCTSVNDTEPFRSCQVAMLAYDQTDGML